jgi:hypothetical protein
MTTTLYVVGNGFDLHHGIRSAYKDFGGFVKAHDSESYGLIESYFDVDDEFWSHFEARLADFDADTLIEKVSDALAPYSAEDWKDSSHHDYQFEIERVVQGGRAQAWSRGSCRVSRSSLTLLAFRNPSACFFSEGVACAKFLAVY